MHINQHLRLLYFELFIFQYIGCITMWRYPGNAISRMRVPLSASPDPRGTKRMRDDEQIRIPQRSHIKSQTHKEELQQMNNMGMASRKTTCGLVGVGVGVGVRVGWGLKILLLARNLALNSDAVPSYKYMSGQHKGPLHQLSNANTFWNNKFFLL